jgi:hypothetical protein
MMLQARTLTSDGSAGSLLRRPISKGCCSETFEHGST